MKFFLTLLEIINISEDGQKTENGHDRRRQRRIHRSHTPGGSPDGQPDRAGLRLLQQQARRLAGFRAGILSIRRADLRLVPRDDRARSRAARRRANGLRIDRNAQLSPFRAGYGRARPGFRRRARQADDIQS